MPDSFKHQFLLGSFVPYVPLVPTAVQVGRPTAFRENFYRKVKTSQSRSCGSELGRPADGKGITGHAEDGKNKLPYTVRILLILLLFFQLSIAE